MPEDSPVIHTIVPELDRFLHKGRFFHQLSVGTIFHNFSLLKDQNAVYHSGNAQAVGNKKRGSIPPRGSE